VKDFEDARSYRAFERALVDPCSNLRSFIDEQACCGDFGGPARSKRVSLRSRPNFARTKAELFPRTRSTGAPSSLKPMVTRSPLARTDEARRRPATKIRCRRPRAGHGYRGRNAAPSPNISCVFPNLTRACLTALAATKRDCGVRPRKP